MLKGNIGRTSLVFRASFLKPLMLPGPTHGKGTSRKSKAASNRTRTML
jgi:hypothetical protein